MSAIIAVWNFNIALDKNHWNQIASENSEYHKLKVIPSPGRSCSSNKLYQSSAHIWEVKIEGFAIILQFQLTYINKIWSIFVEPWTLNKSTLPPSSLIEMSEVEFKIDHSQIVSQIIINHQSLMKLENIDNLFQMSFRVLKISKYNSIIYRNLSKYL